jgi:orotate phosphoribosyltransferase
VTSVSALRGRASAGTMATMDHRERLKELLVERSVRVGDFTLASGARSSYYVDARRTTMCAEGQVLVGHVGFDVIVHSGLDPTHVGGLTMGADPVSYAIAHRSWLAGRPMDGFSVRKKAKDHGTGQRIEGGLPEGARCLVIEDSMTSGASAMAAVSVVREHGAQVIGVLTVVDREEGGRALLEENGLLLLSLYTGRELLEAARAAGRAGA